MSTASTAVGPAPATITAATEPTTRQPQDTYTRPEQGTVERAQGVTVWLTGLPSAGKTTLAFALAELLRAQGRPVEVLDGDEAREALSPGLGFTKQDRDSHVGRIGFVAQKLAAHGVTVVVPVIAPYADARAAVRERHRKERTPYLEVYVATPVEVCAKRDVKGLYARQAAGEISGLTGVDDPYEVPERPDLRIDTQGRTVAQTVAQLNRFLRNRRRS